MARCELARTCPFFNGKQVMAHQTAEQFKARYCKGANTQCARYILYVVVGRENVPLDMAPNDQLWARRLIHTRSRSGAPKVGPH